MAADRPKSRHALHAANAPDGPRRRPSFSILPFAEIYTVIDFVSLDSEGGWCESPVHLEGHRLVHGRLVGRVRAGRSPSPSVLRRGPRRLPRRVGRTARAVRPLPTPRRPHRTRRQSGRRLCRVPVPRLAVGTRRDQPLHPVPAGSGPTRHSGYRCTRFASSTAACSSGINPTARSRSGRCRTCSHVSAVRHRPVAYYRPTRSFRAAPKTSRSSADRRGERAGQLALPLRAWRHGDSGVPGLEDRRRGMAVPHGLAGCA